MIIRQLNSASADVVRVNVKNVSGATMTMNRPVCLAISTAASFDGISAVLDATSDAAGWIGVSTLTVANNGYGIAQPWGYYASCLLSEEGSSITFTALDILAPIATTGLSSETNAGTFAFKVQKIATNKTTTTVSAGGYLEAFYECL